MLKKLLIVFASGLFLALVSLSLAWLVGGEELRSQIHNDGVHWTFDDEDDGPRETRTFDFDPAESLAVRMPVELRFERGEETEMKITGRKELLEKLEVEGNVIDMPGTSIRNGAIRVTITAPTLAGLKLEAAGNVRLKELDQDSFTISAAGAVDVDAEGRVDTLDIEAWGASDFDFRDVEARDASVEMRGAGSADIAADGEVDVVIEGVGSVTLHRKPAKLTSQIDGIGTVKHRY